MRAWLPFCRREDRRESERNDGPYARVKFDFTVGSFVYEKTSFFYCHPCDTLMLLNKVQSSVLFEVCTIIFPTSNTSLALTIYRTGTLIANVASVF